MTAITASPPLRRAVPLRIGLVLATLLAVAGAVPALMIGLDGSAWDPIVIIIAVLSGGVALGTLALVAFAWNGRRGPCIAIIVLQIVSILPALPRVPAPRRGDRPWRGHRCGDRHRPRPRCVRTHHRGDAPRRIADRWPGRAHS